ncbi:MAG: hypothetical protein JWL86_4899 [Rhizobium sp.]|nr:hypothetical protein [Rhizobium sp.]
MTRDMSAAPPFSYRVKVGQISHNALEIRIEADDGERAALARFWDIVSVEALSAELKLRRWKKDGVKVFGIVHAKVTQACVVTLEPVPEVIDEDVDETLVPEGSPLARIPANDQGEIMIDAEGPDLPAPFTGDAIDVGAIVAEIVAMALDPYPRKPGVAFENHIEGNPKDDVKPSPFAVLKTLKGE